MMKRLIVLAAVGLALAPTVDSYALVWGVNPAAPGNELVSIDPFTGVVARAFSLAGTGIQPSHTEIGLAGWSRMLYYTNAHVANGGIYVIDSTTGITADSFTLDALWEIDGLGFHDYEQYGCLYTSGCHLGDLHRYYAVDLSMADFMWSSASDPRAVAGDVGGRIFTYATDREGWGIYEVNPLVNEPATFFAASPSDSIVGMAYDGTYLYLSDLSGRLYTMNTDGLVVHTLDLGYTLYALGSTESIPVPGAMALVCFGIGLMGYLRRRKRLA